MMICRQCERDYIGRKTSKFCSHKCYHTNKRITDGLTNTQRYTKTRRENNLCIYCGQRPPVQGKAQCPNCIWKRSAIDCNITIEQINKIYENQNGICPLTGRKLTKGINTSVDHIKHKIDGGDNSIDNLRIVVWDANRARGTLTDTELRQLCYDIINTIKSD